MSQIYSYMCVYIYTYTYIGCILSLDWTAGLEYSTGILDWNAELDHWTGMLNWITGLSYFLFGQVSVRILRLATLLQTSQVAGYYG